MKIYRIAQGQTENLINKTKELPRIDELTCPFCKEDGFDTIGLKSHLIKGDCEIFNNTGNLERLNY